MFVSRQLRRSFALTPSRRQLPPSRDVAMGILACFAMTGANPPDARSFHSDGPAKTRTKAGQQSTHNSSSVKLLTFANAVKPGLCEHARSALFHGHEFHIFGTDYKFSSPWQLMEDRPIAFAEYINRLVACRRAAGQSHVSDYIIIADGYDVLVQASPKVVRAGL